MPNKPAPSGFRRITIDVREPLHRNIKVSAASAGKPMGKALLEVLEATFGGKPTKTRTLEKAT